MAEATKKTGRGETLEQRLAALDDMAPADLKAMWRRLYRCQPPNRLSRDLLRLGIAWKIQEQALGGLRPAVKRQLAGMADEMVRGGDITRTRITQPKPGAKLMRVWNGVTHTVEVLDEGFAWNGATWTSLSAIARAITGARWSGPRFFGLTGPDQRSAATRGEANDA